LLDILDKHSEPDVILRVLTCLVNIHSITVEKTTRESQTAVMPSTQSELPNAAAVSTQYSFDGEYLQRLHEKLSCLHEHRDSNIQDTALRLLSLCQ